jgi:hypothetical protein
MHDWEKYQFPKDAAPHFDTLGDRVMRGVHQAYPPSPETLADIAFTLMAIKTTDEDREKLIKVAAYLRGLHDDLKKQVDTFNTLLEKLVDWVKWASGWTDYKMKDTELRSRVKSILADGKWTHDHYNVEQMEELMIEVLSKPPEAAF